LSFIRSNWPKTKTCGQRRITTQGVSYSKQKDLPSSIEAYTRRHSALIPNDKEARENLQKALTEQKKQQEEQNKNGGGGGGMSQKEAEEKLKQLQQKEKDLQKRLQNAGKAKGRRQQRLVIFGHP
jgi:Ca-activated chloride channel family protein